MNWSPEEVEILKELYPKPDITLDDLQKILKSRTKTAIVNKAENLGLRKPVGGEIDYDYLKKLRETIEG